MDICSKVGDENLVGNHEKDDCEECRASLVYVENGRHITREQYEFERSVVHLNYIARCLAQFTQ